MYSISRHLAWLSICRRKTRSLMVIMMIALSLSGLLGLQGLYDGMISHMINTTIRSDCGEISLYNKAYRLNKSLDYRLDNITKYYLLSFSSFLLAVVHFISKCMAEFHRLENRWAISRCPCGSHESGGHLVISFFCVISNFSSFSSLRNLDVVPLD